MLHKINIFYIGVNHMVEVTLTLEYKGKNYRTNVIVKKDTPQNEINCIAHEQIMKQWSN